MNDSNCLVLPLSDLDAHEEPLSVAPVRRITLPTEAPPDVVVAPVVQGKSFVLSGHFNPQSRAGQLLVTRHRFRPDPALSVMEVHLPMARPGKVSGESRERYFLGDRRIDQDCLPMLCDIRVSLRADGSRDRAYRLLYRFGKVYQDWRTLDLSRLKLRMTDEQRDAIAAFAGVVFQPNAESPRRTHHTEANPQKRQPYQSSLGGLFQRAGTSPGAIKSKLHEATPEDGFMLPVM